MKSVTLCASNRFSKQAESFIAELRKHGVVVYSPHFYTANYGGLAKVEGHNKKFIAMGLTLDHFSKIRRGDVVFIYNEDGYSGNSVTLEIGFATALDKPIYALSNKDEEACRDILFAGYAATPEELIQVLQ
ncbi:MAG: MazG nucleotide pyrophosphohydrolase [Candidatus Taylorbacteria bacterium]|nr:MazG nucleotide pyrophosphohydrolase [Candidatus Taylorbacteria bacterium]